MHQTLDDEQGKCVTRIRAVVFCGTPHRGSDTAAWGRIAANLVATAFIDSNSKLLADLQVHAATLESIQEDFLRSVHKCSISIHTFQEGRGSSGAKWFAGKVS